jgi:hypothetical protein
MPPNKRVIAIVALVVIAFFSTFAVQEYFAWNRARWHAIDRLRARGVPIEQIDGGPEPWSFYELANAERKKARQGHPPRDFMLTFHRLPGYRVVFADPFSGFLGTRRGAIYTLTKLPVQPLAR